MQVASAACEDDFPYLAGCGADQHVSSSRVGLPLTGHGLQRQARQYRSGQDPVDHRDPALGPQHRVIQRTRPGHRAPRRVGAAGARRSWHAQRPLTEAEAALAELHTQASVGGTPWALGCSPAPGSPPSPSPKPSRPCSTTYAGSPPHSCAAPAAASRTAGRRGGLGRRQRLCRRRVSLVRGPPLALSCRCFLPRGAPAGGRRAASEAGREAGLGLFASWACWNLGATACAAALSGAAPVWGRADPARR